MNTPEVGSRAWLSMRRRELATEWAAMPIDKIQVGVREVQDVAWELGIDITGMTKRDMLRNIQRKVNQP